MANKFKTGLNEEAEKIIQEEEEQQELHLKYQDIAKDKVIVERGGPGETILKVLTGIGKTILTIIVVAMVAVGILALAYPGPREELISIYIDLIGEIKSFFGK